MGYNVIYMYKSLRDSKIFISVAGGSLDIFQQEPYMPVSEDKDLRKLENVVLTLHIGSNTRESNNRMAIVCLENIEKFFSGQIKELHVKKI